MRGASTHIELKITQEQEETSYIKIEIGQPKRQERREEQGDAPLPTQSVTPKQFDSSLAELRPKSVKPQEPRFAARQCSMKADTLFGWKPTYKKLKVTPIPLCYGLVQYNQDDLI